MMMRPRALAVTILLAARVAAAQPGQTPPNAQRFRLLSEEDRELIARGEVSDGQIVGGGLVGTVFGFGLGHVVEGRYLDRGWIFTAGETVATAMLIKYLSDCYHVTGPDTCNQQHGGWLAGGMLLALGFRLWEILDVWHGPSVLNERVREARWRAGLTPVGFEIGPAPGAGGTASLTLRF